MGTHNICFRGEIRKINIFWLNKSTLTGGMQVTAPAIISLATNYHLHFRGIDTRWSTL